MKITILIGLLMLVFSCRAHNGVIMKNDKIITNDSIEYYEYNNPLAFEVKENIISFNYGALISRRFSFSYERLFLDSKLGVKIPVEYSYENPNDEGNNRMLYDIGLDINFYPLGQERLTYLLGGGVRFGVVKIKPYYPYMSNWGYTQESYSEKKIAAGLYVNNGVTFHIVEHLSISGIIGLGIKDVEGPIWPDFHSIGELNLSIRF